MYPVEFCDPRRGIVSNRKGPALMKSLYLLACVPLVGCLSTAQVPSADYPAEQEIAAPMAPVFAPEQLDQLLAPIALYPDALIALILPASTTPADIVLAARYFEQGGPVESADLQPWSDSVCALAHYPQVVRWMDQNLAWTQQLGQAVLSEQPAVMDSIQRLRSRALAAGTLVNTAQQQVVVENGTIAIVPTDPNTIYIPYYNPAVVYAPQPYGYYPTEPFFSFSAGFGTGWWLSYGLDWPDRRVWTVRRAERERYWREHGHDWTRHPPEHRPDRDQWVHEWHPRNDRDRGGDRNDHPRNDRNGRGDRNERPVVHQQPPSGRPHPAERVAGPTPRHDNARPPQLGDARTPHVNPHPAEAPRPIPTFQPAPVGAPAPWPTGNEHRNENTRGPQQEHRPPTFVGPSRPVPAPASGNPPPTWQRPTRPAPGPTPTPAQRWTPAPRPAPPLHVAPAPQYHPAPAPHAAPPPSAPAPAPSDNSRRDNDSNRGPNVRVR